MKRLPSAVGVFALGIAVPFLGMAAANRFDQKLSKDLRVIHALNRLTFGPRPGDIERVRRMGVEKWIDLQLHPERVAEEPILAAKLKPLQTVQLTTAQILQTYQRGNGALAALNVVQVRLAGARGAASITPQERQTFLRGSTEQKQALLNSVDADKRRQIVAALPPDAFADLPEVRRESMAARQPPQYVNSELMENKLYRALYSNRQLEEVLVDFWLNHFNVFNGKGS